MENNTLKQRAGCNNTALEEVQVIARNNIPAIHSITQNGEVHHLGEVRDFQWHEVLKNFLPSNEMISFSWVRLKPGERLLPHAHPMKSMIILVKGSGRLTGQKNLPLQEGDIVITPPNCSHGFDSGEDGVYGFSIQFEEGIYTDPENARVKFLGDEEK
jgi:quercetin dioxygenase-like cupin family protein